MTNVVEQAKHVHRTNRACSPNKLVMFAGQAGLVRMHEAMQTYAQAYACVCIASCVRTCKPDLHFPLLKKGPDLFHFMTGGFSKLWAEVWQVLPRVWKSSAQNFIGINHYFTTQKNISPFF